MNAAAVRNVGVTLLIKSFNVPRRCGGSVVWVQPRKSALRASLLAAAGLRHSRGPWFMERLVWLLRMYWDHEPNRDMRTCSRLGSRRYSRLEICATWTRFMER